jgi:hypothetical protein
MATSGVTTFTRNRDQIIRSALRKCGAFDSGETPDADSVSEATEALNVMIKHWQASGIHIWSTQEATLFPQLGQTSYVISSTSTDHATPSYTETALTVAAVLGAGTITVASVTGIATTYKIGVQLDDGTLQWTTVNGAPAGLVVTLTAVLTDSAAIGNRVLVYQTNLVRPLKIISARRYNFASAIDTPLLEMDRVEYQSMPNKTNASTINSFYYDRRGGATNSGLIYLWPAPANVDEAVEMTVARPIEDFTVAADEPDLPVEWVRAIEWGLADEIADDYDVPEPKRSRIERRATQYLNEVNWWERELVSIELVPDMRR